MDSQNAIEYITRVDWRHSRLGLERMAELLARMGDPQEKLAFVHVAGTNGKGSVSAMMASVLQAAGCTVGLYTSPFIHTFSERIRVNGEPISDAALAEATGRVRPLADAMADHPTEFELVTAIAFEHFVRRGCDVVVLEVGMGGRLDATNSVSAPVVAAITALGLDHTEQLGDTIEAMAAEKAGIIKPGCRVVSAPQPPTALAVIEAACRAAGVPLAVADPAALNPLTDTLDGQSFDYKNHKGLRIALAGAHQTQNAAVAIEIVEALRAAGWVVPEHALHQGLAAARWAARFEVLHRRPTVVLDGAHNPQGAALLAENLAHYFPGQRLTFVTGVMADKDWPAMLAPLQPLAARFFTVAPGNPRALPAAELAAWLGKSGTAPAAPRPTVADALDAALAAAGADGAVCAFGSLYMAGAVREHFGLAGISASIGPE